MLPLWLASMMIVGYLISAELFTLHAICIYCTLAHACSILMGIPVVKLSFSADA